MRKKSTSSRALGVWLLALACGTPTFGQGDAPRTIEEIQARLQAAEEAPAGEDARSVEEYELALAALLRAEEAHSRSEKLAAEAAEAPTLLAALQEELASPPDDTPLVRDTSLSLSELESRLEQARADVEASRAELVELDGIAEHRSERKAALPEELAALQQFVSEAEETLSALPVGAENEARRTLLQAQLEEFRATTTALETERDTYEARRELLPLRRDRALRRLTQAEKVAAFRLRIADSQRAAEGEAAARSAAEQLDDLAGRFPPLRELATRTQELAARRSGPTGLPKRISRAQAALASTRLQLEEVRSRYRAARRRISAGGLTEGMGLILRRDYEWLPRASDQRAESVAREKLLSEAQLELIATEEERGAIGDLSTATERLLSELQVPSPSTELQSAARELLTSQRASHDAVLGDLETLSSTYYEHKELTSSLVAESLAYREFIEKRILWVRSSPPNPLKSSLAAPAHAAQIARTLGSQATREEVAERAIQRLGGILAMGLLLSVLVAARRLLKRKRLEMGERVRSFRTDKYIYTARALIQSLLLALPMPLVAWTAGWTLVSSAEELVSAVGDALQEIAAIWLFFRFLRELVVDKGVGSAHFKWPAASNAALRKEMRWFEPLALTLGFVALTMDRQSSTAWADSVGRLCFVGAMAALATFAHRLLRVESQMWAISPSAGKGLLGRTHGIWSLLACGLPAMLALLAIAGYYYTALQFELRLRYSIGFAVALVLVNALLLRWLFMTRRRLAVRQALEAKARKEQEGESEGATESSTAALEEDKVDIPAIDAQTRRLFKTSITLATVVGLFFIWASVLPALRGLDRVQLLPKLAIVSSEADLESSSPSTLSTPAANGEVLPPASLPGTAPLSPATPADGEANGLGLPSKLTLADVLLALLFALLTSVAAKNLPALLELAVLQRLPLDGGSRYAVSTIVRYLILIVGVSAISGALGIGWQKIQWLAAALTFGLAFGLQEIFANFVSGLIILVERPIRVGDIVTVGQTEGRVTQLRMRATTILDWDRREYLVPNKEFITGSVINWTLSDPVTRMVVPVGIAYGSDTAKARRLLLEAAKKNPLVLETPAPSAIFRSFGASSLDFELRMFIANRDLWPELIDKIHSKIDEAFRKADIEIAFPQRDLHIRTAEGLRDLRTIPEGDPRVPES